LLSGPVAGQVFRFRLSANSGAFLGEPGEAEKVYPMGEEMSYPGSRGFSPRFYPGAELEITTPLTTDFECGLQFGYNRFSGYTPQAPFYNFFLSRYNPLRNTQEWYPDEGLIFDSRVLSTLATARWFFLSFDGTLNFFMKLSGGVAFTGSDFTFHDPVHRVQYDVGVLYARGTRNSEDPKQVGFQGGGGLGATYRLSENLDICLDAGVSFIQSDLVNGVPNYDYSDSGGEGTMQPVTCIAEVARASIGIIFSATPDRRFRHDNITRALNQDKTLFDKRSRKRSFRRR
jgi:hypothetical protein